MINLLIALLSSVYDKFVLKVDAAHRVVLISYYRRLKWNDEYGWLIFLTTPLNVLNWPVLFFYMFMSFENREERKAFNEKICKYFYLIYLIPQTIFFFFYTICLIPVCYFKGIIIVSTMQGNLNIESPKKVFNIMKWVLGGFCYLCYISIRDIYYILSTVFFKPILPEDDIKRFSTLIGRKEISVFLKFIHENNTEKNAMDLHEIFFEYLLFEQDYEAKKNKEQKEKLEYFKKIDQAVNQNRKTLYTKIKRATVQHLAQSNNGEVGFEQMLVNKYIKKNIIIIEVLENFLLSDGSSNSSIVNLAKLRMLLPKTGVIDKEYTKRMVYSDIKSLSMAVNKLKHKKNIFLQYTLLNKIIAHVIRLDKEVDSEIAKTYRNFKVAHKDEETEEDMYMNYYNLLMERMTKVNQRIKNEEEENK